MSLADPRPRPPGAIRLAALALSGLLVSAVGSKLARASEPAVTFRAAVKELSRGAIGAFEVAVAAGEGVDGDAALGLVLPPGVTVVEGSARVVEGAEQAVAGVFGRSPRGTIQLRSASGGASRGLSLPAGGVARLQFSLRFGPAAGRGAPGGLTGAGEALRVAITARLEDLDGSPRSREAVAKVALRPDAELELGLALGTVFCDADRDGARDEDELGLGGVRVVSDTGRAVDTDLDGRWHLRDLKPGAHVLKLDVNTLPPPSAPVGPPRALVDVTAGLTVRADFAVTCARVTAKPETLIPPPPEHAGGGAPAEVSVVSGNAARLAAQIGDIRLPPLRLELLAGRASGPRAQPPSGARSEAAHLNLPWDPADPEPSVVLGLRVDQGDALLPVEEAVERWQVAIHRQDDPQGPEGPPVRLFLGAGALPERLVWDGRDAAGAVVFGRGRRVVVRAEVARVPHVATGGPGGLRVERERLVSAPRLLGHAWRGAAPADLELASYRLDTPRFEATGEPSRTLEGFLDLLTGRVRGYADAHLLVELAIAGGTTATPPVMARRWATGLRDLIGRLYGTPEARLHVRLAVGRRADGLAGAPVELRLSWQRPEPEEAPPALQAAPAGPQALLDGAPLGLGARGDFAAVVPHQAGVGLRLVAPDGAARELLLTPPEAVATEEEARGRLARQAAEDPLASFGGRALAEALGEGAVAVGARGRATADVLEIVLPPRGSVMAAPRLFVSGRTDPGNIVTVAGERLHVRADGQFWGLVALPRDLRELAVESRDATGHVARLAWPLSVSPTEHFLLALGDASGGLDAALTELPHYDTWRKDGLFMAGRAALLARGRVSGAVLGRELRYAVHADTARRDGFEPYFQQMIDPARDYVIFGDATDDTLVSSNRGPLYVLLEVDRSKLGYGSFHTDLRGVHLFRYERTFDGAHADVTAPWSDGLETRLRAFATSDNRALVRRHDELRATGGSLYYLSHKGLARGSERVDVVIRELGTGMELGRARLERDRHYRIDYTLGRLTTEGPVPSVMDALFSIGPYQPFAGRGIQQGHEVWLVVGYEAEASRAGGDMAYGAQLKQQLGEWLEVGAGVAREGRPTGAAGPSGDYLVWGTHARVRASETSWAALEVSGTTASEGVARRSTDGGLRFDPLARTPEVTRGGLGLFAAAEADVGELAGRPPDALDLRLRAHWQLLQPGFRVAGLASEEGSEKWGGEVVWRPHDTGQVRLRYDGGAALLSQELAAGAPAVRRLERHRLLGRYEHALAPRVTLHGEATFGDQADALDGPTSPLSPRLAVLSGGSSDSTASRALGGLAVGARWRLSPELTLLASQEALFGGDDRVLGRGGAARVRTEAGAELALTEGTRLRALGSLRWSGDHAARLGVVTAVDGGGQAYLEERLERGSDNARLVRASVVGLESDLGGGRAFGEYRLDGGVGGRTNRAVLGLSRGIDLGDGVRALLAWERSAALSTGAVGRGARDVFSGGLQLLGWDRLKLQGLFEARWDRDRPGEAAAEVLQALSRVNGDLSLGDGLTLLGLLDHALTQDLATRAVLVEDLLATLALAWRPVRRDDVILTLRWTRTARRAGVARLASPALLAAVDLALEPSEAAIDTSLATSDLLSVGGVFELPWRLQLTEKLAWRRSTDRATDGLGVSEATVDAALWLTRLAFHVVSGLDLAAELRLVASLAARNASQSGGLLEVAWRVSDYTRLGVGWSLGAASTLEPEALRTELKNGLYLRMSGLY